MNPKVGFDLAAPLGAAFLIVVALWATASSPVVAIPLELLGLHVRSEAATGSVFVSLQDNGVIYLGRSRSEAIASDWRHFLDLIDRLTGGDRSRDIYMRADPSVPYSDVTRLVDLIHGRGYRNKLLVTEDVGD